MALRQIEITVPASEQSKLRAALGELDVIDMSFSPCEDDRALVRILIETVRSEAVLDHLERNFSLREGFRLTLLPVEGTLPRRDKGENKDRRGSRFLRINRLELVDELESGVEPNRIFFATVLLSAVVAAVGLARNDVAIIIGAMVIAPLLTPNMALALVTTLGDTKLIYRALKTNLLGLIVALAFAVMLGMVLNVDPDIAAIRARTEVGLSDLALALAAGSAGALAFTTGVSASLVGVMVAVALMPPLIVCGLFMGSQQFGYALGALLLVATNVICVNLTAVVTFLIQGIRPQTWYETDRAKRATRVAIGVWGTLLVALVILLSLARRF